MIHDRALAQTLAKLQRLEGMLYERIFVPVDTVAVRFYQAAGPLDAVPEAALFGPLPADGLWGAEGAYGWFLGTYAVPERLGGEDLYLYPRIEGYEALLYVDGRPHSNYAAKELLGSHGNHYANRFLIGARPGETVDLALEYYAHHDMPGTQPFSNESRISYRYPIGPVEVCLRDELYLGYWADLRTLLMLVQALPESSFRRADVLGTLLEVHRLLLYDPECAEGDTFRAALEETRPLLAAQLLKHNGPTMPYVGLVGHSHMDTAWLWPLDETTKKCARTYANQLTLMAQYPEYRFVQSSAYHLELMRLHYPNLFERIGEAIADGRYEPNGGVWVECDCNITGGEYLARQFVWGQRYTQAHFGYRADTFWLPDTFGYNSAIPQIMALSGISYFLTTKMTWNDTNRFPYTTFLWQGIDGTRVLTHRNRIHTGPDPLTLAEMTFGELDGGGDWIQEKPTSAMRLFSYGKGDGGGGPEFEMLEMARRVGDLEGVPRTSHTSVTDFMRQLEAQSRDLTCWAGELYLELHRGTLTNMHDIKRNNRKAELALHDLELATVQAAVREGAAADGAAIAPLLNTLLVNQFHDILPGTSIHTVHAQAIAEVGGVIDRARAMEQALLATGDDTDAVTVHNTLGFARHDTVYLPVRDGMRIAGGYPQQRVTDVYGGALLAVAGVTVPPLGSVSLRWEPGEPEPLPCPFEAEGDLIVAPHASLLLDAAGGIASLTDARTGRELRHPDGHPLNTLLLAEDVSAAWDNWDIDADLMDKFAPTAKLLSREVVSIGPVELRVRSRYRLSERSTLTQDMIVQARDPAIVFETVMDWQDDHRFLKAAFDTSLIADGARHEIQFGHIRRSNHRGTAEEKARFEVCNHRFTDLSEANNGMAILNDCKYGISCEEGSLWLSLHKGGNRPDSAGDKGLHRCRYALLPHAGGFGAENVIQPAYALNARYVLAEGTDAATPSLLALDTPDVVIETVKPCEDAERAYIVRLYEATGGTVCVTPAFGHDVTSLEVTNLLEETVETLAPGEALSLRPFEIKTLRVGY